MIVCVEFQFDGDRHEECNSGIIRLLEDTFKEDLYVVAERGHISALRRAGIPDEVHFLEEDILPRAYSERQDKEEEFFLLFHKVVESLQMKRGDKFVVMSSPKAITMAALRIADMYGIDCIFIEHANFEKLLCDEEQQKSPQYNYRDIVNKVGESNHAYMLTFSPFARSRLKDIVSKQALGKLFFIHHPMDGHACALEENSDRRTIGVYGACVNANFRSMLKKGRLDGRYNFLVLRRALIDRLDYKYMFPDYIEFHQAGGMIPREEQMRYLRRMAWILMPYDESMYRISMSGILADAVRCGRPIIALNSPIVEWYNNRIRPIGVLEPSLEQLIDRLEKGDIMAEYESYVQNMKELKEAVNRENRIIIKKIMCFGHE